MQKLSFFFFIVGVVFFIGFNSFAETEVAPTGSLKIKEFIRDFDIKISKPEILKMIDTLSQSGQISKSDAEKAKKEISAMSDEQFTQSTKKAVQKIPDDMTLDDASDTKKAMEKLKKSAPGE